MSSQARKAAALADALEAVAGAIREMAATLSTSLALVGTPPPAETIAVEIMTAGAISLDDLGRWIEVPVDTGAAVAARADRPARVVAGVLVGIRPGVAPGKTSPGTRGLVIRQGAEQSNQTVTLGLPVRLAHRA